MAVISVFQRSQEKQERSSSLLLLIIAIAMTTAVIFARDLFDFQISKWLVLASVLMPSFFMRYDSLVYYLFFLLPLSCGLPGNYLFPLLLLLILLKSKIALQRHIIVFFIIVFYEIIHYVFYTFEINFAEVIGYFATVFLLCYFVTLDCNKNKLVNTDCALFFCVGLLVLLLGIWYIAQEKGGIVDLLESGSRIGASKQFVDREDELMIGLNPNQLAYFSLVGLSIIFTLYSLKKIHLVLMVLFGSVFVIVGAFSVSRTWLLGLVLLVVLLVLLSGKNKMQKVGFRIFMLLVIVAVGAYVLIQNELFHEIFLMRFSDSTLSTAGDRTNILRDYNEALVNNPIYLLFGAGAVHYSDVFNLEYSTHNGTQQIIVSYGILGLIFFLFLTINAVRMNYRKGYAVCLIPFLTALFFVQSGQLLNPYMNLYPFIVSFLIMRISDDLDKTCNV